MATIYRGKPKKIRGGWGASVPDGAEPGDFVEVETQGGKKWLAEVTRVKRGSGGAVAETKKLSSEEQEATLANVPFAGSEPTGAGFDAPTKREAADDPATNSRREPENRRSDGESAEERFTRGRAERRAEMAKRQADAIRSMPEADWTFRDGAENKEVYYAPFTRELKDWIDRNIGVMGSRMRPVRDADGASVIGWRPAETDELPPGMASLPVATSLVEGRIKAHGYDQKLIDMSHALSSDFKPETPPGRELFPEQRAGVAYAIEQGGEALIADEPGVGKTAQALVVANERDAKRILVLAPPNTLYNWRNEGHDWLTEEMPIHVVQSSDQRFPLRPGDDEGMVIVAYDNLGKWREQLRDNEWDLIIVDESHKLKDPTTQRTQEVIGCIAEACAARTTVNPKTGKTVTAAYPAPEAGIAPLEADDKIFLTGTPMVKNPIDLWSTLSYLNPEYWGDSDEARLQFTARYIDWEKDESGRTLRNTEEFNKRLRESAMVRRKMEDVNPDMPPKYRRVVPIELDAKAADGWSAKADIEESLARAQIDARGLPPLPRITEALMAYSEIKAPLAAKYVADEVEANPADNIIFFSKHVKVGDAIAAELKERGIPYTRVQGGMKDADKEQQVVAFQTGEYPVMVATMGTLKEGSNLFRANRVVFAEVDWNSTDLQQAENRAWRRGQTRPVQVDYLMLADSLDMDVAQIALQKQQAISQAIGGSSGNDISTSGDATAQAEIAVAGGLAAKLRQIRAEGAQRKPTPKAQRTDPPRVDPVLPPSLLVEAPAIEAERSPEPPTGTTVTDLAPPPEPPIRVVETPETPPSRLEAPEPPPMPATPLPEPIAPPAPSFAPEPPPLPVPVEPVSMTAAPPVGQTRFPIGSLNPEIIEMRPDLFQGRETSSGKAYDETAVQVIVDNFDFERFDPIAVVADPDHTSRYVVIAGHHRLEAVKRLQTAAPGSDFDAVPVRILSGDINEAEQRQALVNAALLSNYTVRGTNVREDARTMGTLRSGGMSIPEIATQMSVNQSAVRRLLWLNEVPPTIIDRAVLQPELLPAVTQLGKAKADYGLTDEQIDGVFRRLIADYEETEKIPSERVIGGTLRLLAENRGEGGTQAGMLEGMGTDVILAEYQRRAQRAEDLRNAQARLRSRLSSCEALALELGVDIEEIKQRANTRADELTAEQEAEVRRTLAAHSEEWSGPQAPAPDDPAAPDAPAQLDGDLEPAPFLQSGPDLFGGGDTLPVGSQTVASATGDSEPGEQPPFLQSGLDLFDVPTEPAPADGPAATAGDPYRDPDNPAFGLDLGRWNQRFFTTPYYPATVRTEAEARRRAKESMESHLRTQEGLPYTPAERERVEHINAVREQAIVDYLLGYQPAIATRGNNFAAEMVSISRAARRRLHQRDSGTDPFRVVAPTEPFTMEVNYQPMPAHDTLQMESEPTCSVCPAELPDVPPTITPVILDMPQPEMGQGPMFATNATPTMFTPRPGGALAEDPDVRVYLSQQEATPLAGQAGFDFDAAGNLFVPRMIQPKGAIATVPVKKGRSYKATAAAKSGRKPRDPHPFLRTNELMTKR